MAKKRKPSKRRRESFEETTHIKQGSIKVKQRKPPKASVPKVIGKTRSLNQVEKDYRKQEQRIKQFIRRAEKRGYLFDYQLPAEPSRVTRRDVNRLKGIKPEYLYTQAIYIKKETGEVFTGTERRAQERKESAAKAARTRQQKKNQGSPPSRTDQILAWIESRISDYEEQYSTNRRWTKGHVDITHYGFDLRNFYRDAINDYGRDEIARRFEIHPEVKEYADVVFADSKEEAIIMAFNGLISVLLAQPLSAIEAEYLEEDSDYNDTFEY